MRRGVNRRGRVSGRLRRRHAERSDRHLEFIIERRVLELVVFDRVLIEFQFLDVELVKRDIVLVQLVYRFVFELIDRFVFELVERVIVVRFPGRGR